MKDLFFKDKLESEKFFSELALRYGEAIAGADEVGRGACAGPLVAGCVLLPANHGIRGIADSKKLTSKRRSELSEQIVSIASYGLGVCEASEVDLLGVKIASRRAAAVAVKDCLARTSIDFLICDGNLDVSSLVSVPTVTVAKGDDWFECVSAASIVAKVYHDQQMAVYHELYPEYLMNKNQGYGTPAHLKAIENHGLTPLHRRTFLSSYLSGYTHE